MKQPVDYKEKYNEARKELSELRKLVQKQDKYIIKLLDKLAEKNKQEMHQEGELLGKEKEKSRLLAKELRDTKKLLEEKSQTVERLSRLCFENGFGFASTVNAIKKLNAQRNTDIRPLKRKLEPVIDPRPHDSKPPQPRPQRYVSDYISALLDCGVDALRLHPNVTACLEKGGITTVYDLVTTPKSELVKIEGITSSRLCTIRDKIKPMRLELEMPVKYIPETRKYIKLSETEKQ